MRRCQAGVGHASGLRACVLTAAAQWSLVLGMTSGIPWCRVPQHCGRAASSKQQAGQGKAGLRTCTAQDVQEFIVPVRLREYGAAILRLVAPGIWRQPHLHTRAPHYTAAAVAPPGTPVAAAAEHVAARWHTTLQADSAAWCSKVLWFVLEASMNVQVTGSNTAGD